MEIDEFLLARIAEDEALANAVDPAAAGDWLSVVEWPCYLDDATPALMLAWSPTRVIAECEAKRALVEDVHVWLVSDFEPQPLCLACRTEFPCRTLRALAHVWLDHPDFDPAWTLAAAGSN